MESNHGSMDETELSVAEAVATALRAHGSVMLEYLTAEFEPFSSAFRPDIVFIPSEGPNRDRVFVVEVRMTKPNYRPNVKALISHRDFVLADLDEYQFFAIATTAELTESEVAELAIDGVHTIGDVSSADEVASAIVRWSETAETPPWTA